MSWLWFSSHRRNRRLACREAYPRLWFRTSGRHPCRCHRGAIGGISLRSGRPCFLWYSRLARDCDRWSDRVPLSREITQEDLTISVLAPGLQHSCACGRDIAGIPTPTKKLVLLIQPICIPVDGICSTFTQAYSPRPLDGMIRLSPGKITRSRLLSSIPKLKINNRQSNLKSIVCLS